MLDRSQAVADLRRFNRFYTRRLGLLNHTLTQSPYTLTEARVLFEIGYAGDAAEASGKGAPVEGLDGRGLSASDIVEQLHLDPAYLARILKQFTAAGLVSVRPDQADKRRRILSLTALGNRALADLQTAAKRDLSELLAGLDDAEVGHLVDAQQKITRLLTGERQPAPPLVLRPHRVGDIGWVIERQSKLYADEYGWNGEYEALVCEIAARFIRNFKPGKEFCWIAEHNGQRAGAVFLVHRSDDEAQLRMLHVEASARGAGVGSALVAECVNLARKIGYRKMVLWTNDVLAGARRIYERAGFRLVDQETHHSFGHDLHGQNWELVL